MPVYNADRFLKQAVDSILEQTFADFELIAIDDGSTDGSGILLDDYAKKDRRVVVIHQKNTGIVGALNRGIEMSRGEYIARQDSDDVSFQLRFEQQVAVLQSRPEVVLVTGGFEVFDEDDEYLYREVLPANDADIKRSMLLRNPIGHGSVMFRKAACTEIGGYSDEYGPTEDYLLWSKLALKGEFFALESSAFRWRVNRAGITSTKNDHQLAAMKKQINARWEAANPSVIGSKELRQRGREYYTTYKKRGVDMKNVMLADNAQLAFKLMRRGRPFAGLCQLIAVALVGRAGLKAAYHRIRLIRQGTAGAVRRRAKFDRQTAA